MDDNNAREVALIENVQRENLNPIEEANAYKNLMECCDYELADVSRLIGKSASYIRNMLRLTSLPSSVQNLVEQGELSASHARTLPKSVCTFRSERYLHHDPASERNLCGLSQPADQSSSGHLVLLRSQQTYGNPFHGLCAYVLHRPFMFG